MDTESLTLLRLDSPAVFSCPGFLIFVPFQCLIEPEDAKPSPPPPVCDGEKNWKSVFEVWWGNLFFFEGDRLPCANGNGCFTQRQRCDFYPDCLDSTDELGCPNDFFFDQCQQVHILYSLSLHIEDGTSRWPSRRTVAGKSWLTTPSTGSLPPVTFNSHFSSGPGSLPWVTFIHTFDSD